MTNSAEQPWDATLARFTRATGITVTFYNPDLTLASGPHTPTPLAQQLAASGGWTDDGSACRKIDIATARRAQANRTTVYTKGLEYLSLFALPVGGDAQHPPSVLVGGWAFDFFPDSVVSHRLARRLELPFARLWSIVRQQPPLSRVKLETYAELLQTRGDRVEVGSRGLAFAVFALFNEHRGATAPARRRPRAARRAR